jgi:hypothetical protein
MQDTGGKYQSLKILAGEMGVGVDQLLRDEAKYSKKRLAELQREILPETILENEQVRAKIEAFKAATTAEAARADSGEAGGPEVRGTPRTLSERAKNLRREADRQGGDVNLEAISAPHRGSLPENTARWQGEPLPAQNAARNGQSCLR